MSATTETPAGADERPRLLPRESIAKNLILGEIVEENLFPYPAIRSRDREMLGQIVEAIDAFLADKAADFRRWDREGAQPAEFIQSLRELGLFSLIIPEEFGGLELSNAAYARVLARPSSYDSSVSLTIGAHSSIGMKGILLFGTPEQKAALSAAARDRRDDRGVLSHRVGCRLRCRLDPHRGEAQRRRQLDPERREDLDHQRRHRGFLHGVRAHRRTRRARSRPSSSRPHGRASAAARTRTRWAYARRRPRPCHSPTCACRRRTCSARSARASRSR